MCALEYLEDDVLVEDVRYSLKLRFPRSCSDLGSSRGAVLSSDENHVECWVTFPVRSQQVLLGKRSRR
jgi:hypothetical protein